MKKGFILPLAIGVVIAIILLAGFGLWYYKNRTAGPFPPVSDQLSDQEGSGASPKILDKPAQINLIEGASLEKETSSWQNAVKPGIGTLKISFKYPPGWKIDSAATDGDSCDALSVSEDDSFYCGSDSFSPIYIKPLTAGEGLRCKAEIKKALIKGKNVSWCSEIISKDSKIFLYSLPKGSKIIDYFFEDIDGPRNSYKGISAWYTETPGGKNYQKEFSLILSTLEFLGCGPTSEPDC